MTMERTPGPSVLIMAHGFAPASMIGTMRTLRLVRRMVSAGWQPTVLMSSPETYSASTPQDPALMDRVPASVRIEHAPTLRPLDRLSRAVRRDSKPVRPSGASPAGLQPAGNPSLFRGVYSVADELTSIPDREVGWVVPAVLKAMRLIRRDQPMALYSTAPPWSAQVAAYAVSKLSGLPWVADFRDPWARAPWRESQPDRQRRAGVRLESRVVRRASAILFATPANRDEYAAHYGPALARKFFVVPNGCDPEEFRDVPRRTPDDLFTLLHAGSLYGQRSPVPLFQAVAGAIAKGTIDRRRFRVQLIGTSTLDRDITSAISDLGLGDIVVSSPRVPRREIIQAMASASALLALQPGTTVSIPGKVYEYLAMGKPLFALCEEGDTAHLIRSSGVGVVVTAKEVAAIESGLARLLDLASRPVVPPDPHLYDGNRAAEAAMAVIASVGRVAGEAAATIDRHAENTN